MYIYIFAAHKLIYLFIHLPIMVESTQNLIYIFCHYDKGLSKVFLIFQNGKKKNETKTKTKKFLICSMIFFSHHNVSNKKVTLTPVFMIGNSKIVPIIVFLRN